MERRQTADSSKYSQQNPIRTSQRSFSDPRFNSLRHSQGRIKSRPVDSDSDTGSDGLRKFAAESAMARDIEAERRFRESNRGKAKRRAFKPSHRALNADADGEEKLDEKTQKALKWKPKEGRPPEYMTAAVAEQQMKVNPLLKLLGIKIKIIHSDGDGSDSSANDDVESSDTTLSPVRSQPLYASKASKPSSPSDSGLRSEGSDKDLKQSSSSIAPTADADRHSQECMGRNIPKNPSPMSEKFSDDSELSATASEEECSKPPQHIQDSFEAVSELSTTESEEEHTPKPTPGISAVRHGEPRSSKHQVEDEILGKYRVGNSQSDIVRNHVKYPCVQTAARPHFEIMDEAQEAIGPLVLDKTCRLTLHINRFLKPYQRDGVKFLFLHFRAKNGVILGDDMGLGKTIQVIAFLSAVMGYEGIPAEKGRRKKAMNRTIHNVAHKPSDLGPTCLVICPNSLIDNWAREFDTWGYFEYSTLTTGQSVSQIIKRFNAGAFDILICGFTCARNHIDDLYDLDFTIVVVDEVQKLKNHNSAITQAFHRFQSKIRFGLTGTAMQNDLSELHSLFDWVRPGALGTLRMWKAFVSDPILQSRKSNASSYEISLGAERAEALVKNCWPELQLRRTKAKILHELPSRTDKIALCPMTPLQRYAYNNLSTDPDVVNMRKHAEPCPCGKKNKSGQRFPLGLCCDQGWVRRIFPYITVFNKIANHLALVYPNKQERPEKYEHDKMFIQKMFPQDYAKREHHYSCDADPELCGKWIILKPLLEKWKKEGSKVLLFSQRTKIMDILSYWLEQDFPGYVRLDGEVPIGERLARVDAFQKDQNMFIFLASTTAAGVGLNLTAANKVVIFDPSWNPSNDAQAMDRVVRIGQKKPVECIRLISLGSAEELIYHRQVYKQQLSEVANTASTLHRHFNGVQGDKKNQGDIFGVKNLFKDQISGRASFQPEEQGDREVFYALDQLLKHGGLAQMNPDASEFTLKPMEAVPEDPQCDQHSTEAILRACGVDQILNHGEVVRDSSFKRDSRTLSFSSTSSARKKQKQMSQTVAPAPLRVQYVFDFRFEDSSHVFRLKSNLVVSYNVHDCMPG
ncbi:hypothetical protein O181_027274 [Austropuccinia psidii MF-1]|uniref:DNA excision repair protein ERCC-6-like 2 n=1 Tax=Austropuccinia psidii MF-1 TaxID=1389203 RepID=A0A9Q3CLN4_9BASI|nr:hypothetical protein [Austropuccinia psidii MF-1]